MELFPGYDIDFPFGPAAGAINGPIEEEIMKKIDDVAASPAGAIWWGSITYGGGLGNAGITYYHNRLTGQTVNSMALPNVGFKKALKLQRRMQLRTDARDKPLIPSLSPGKGENPLEVLPRMALGFAEINVPALEINYSCPNKDDGKGGREPVLGHDIETMMEVDEKIITEVGRDLLIIRKLPPYWGEKNVLLPQVAAYFSVPLGRTALAISNTWGNQLVLNEKGHPALSVKGLVGGLSGPAMAEAGRDQLGQFKKSLPQSIGLISCIGVNNAAEIKIRLDMGADFTAGVSVLWNNEEWHKKSFGKTITELAEEYVELKQLNP